MKRTAIFCAIAALPFFAVADDANLGTVVITANKPIGDTMLTADNTLSGDNLANRRLGTNDTARLLDGAPGVSFYTGGGVSSLPVIDGLADDRLKLLVDGMSITSACPNHMNPALSYIDPVSVASVSVFAGISPVSVGGDSIGGTIAVRSADPVFATAAEGLKTGGSVSAYYRSNGDVSGGNLRASLANEVFSITYSGATVSAKNYADGKGRQVRSTEYQSRNNLVSLATRSGNHLFSLDLGWQNIPYQGFVNQSMDMTSNKSHSFNARYTGSFDWGQLEARLFENNVRHAMDMLDDKAALGWSMPMDTKSKDSGYAIQADIKLSGTDVLRLGHELHRYALDDWWPPIAGSMMMGPDTFWNIRDGQRDRLAFFGEWEATWTPALSTQLGVRAERVTMNAKDVQGYFATGDDMIWQMMTMGMMGSVSDGFWYQNDANAFNARNHKRTDNNLDFTAAVHYLASDTSTYDIGLARKTRSPNMHERYTWSNEAMMAGLMNNWFGDLNAYVGSLDLKPEVAYTLRASADWHDAERNDWQFKATPFYTRVHDYINAEPNAAALGGMGPAGRVALQLVNHDAKLYGLDLSGSKRLGYAGGEWTGRGVISYVRGKDLDNGGNLYNIMPLNGRLAVNHVLGSWSNSVELVAVSGKHKVDSVRDERETDGYSLVNLSTSYTMGQVRLDVGIDNLFDKQYSQPLGGLDSYTWGKTGAVVPVSGPGRSVNLGLTLSF